MTTPFDRALVPRREAGWAIDPPWAAVLGGEGVAATRLFEQRLRRSPEDIWALRGLGLAFAEREVEVQAVLLLGRAAQRDPDHAETWYWIGQVAPRDTHGDVARDAFRRVTALAPEVADYWAARAGREDGEAALAAVAAALRLDPRHAEALRISAWVHERGGDRRAALDAWARLAEVRSSPDVLRGHARALHAMGRHDDGSAIAHEAVRREDAPQAGVLGPVGALGLGLVGNLLLERGLLDNVRRAYLAQENPDSTNSDVWWGMAAALHAGGRSLDALTLLDRVAGVLRDSAALTRVHRDRAIVLEALGREDEVEAAWEMARMHRDFFRFERAGADALDVTPDGGGRMLPWRTAPVRIGDPWTRRVRPFSPPRGERPL